MSAAMEPSPNPNWNPPPPADEGLDREVRRLCDEAEARLPRGGGAAVGVIYARYSTRFQSSIPDQVRVCLEAAVRHDIRVPAEHVCFDVATTGRKGGRPGLRRLQELLRDRRAGVLLAPATNRLHRKLHRALQFVEEDLVGEGQRAIFVQQGIDTADDQRWHSMLTMHGLLDEQAATMYAANVRSAHEGLLERGLVWGTMPLGYRAEPTAGEPTRRGRPRCRVAVDPAGRAWVERIFAWFADDGVPIAEIVRRLNADPSAARPPRGRTGRWSYPTVRALLTNERYVGRWAYGRTRAVWQGRRDYARKVPRPEPLRERQDESLRLIDDARWAAAQARLARRDPSGGGRRPACPDAARRPRLLGGLLRCPTHDRPLIVFGRGGRYLACPTCRKDPPATRPLFTQLGRVEATRRICEALAGRLRPDAELVDQVVSACREALATWRAGPPAGLQGRARRRDWLTGQIRFVMANAGESDEDRRESAATLARLRRERAELEAVLARERAGRPGRREAPNPGEVRALLDGLAGVLADAGVGDDPEALARARQVVDLLTGGRIEVHQCGERRAQRGWLQARFRMRNLSCLVDELVGLPGHGPSDIGSCEEVVVDLGDPPPSDQRADAVKALDDEGLTHAEIGRRLGLNVRQVRRALDRWFERQGLRRPDGRSRTRRRGASPRRHEVLAGAVMPLYEAGLALQEIAARLGCHRDQVTRAVAHWHQSRGLPVPDGRARRKSLRLVREAGEAPPSAAGLPGPSPGS